MRLAINKIKSQELLKYIEKIEKLPGKNQRILTNLLDTYIKKHKFEQLAQS